MSVKFRRDELVLELPCARCMKSTRAKWLVLSIVLSACAAQPPVGASREAVVNGTVALGVYDAVAGFRGRNCSAVLVAPRVMLSSAHCVWEAALQCSSVPYQVVFANEYGGWGTAESYDARTIDVTSVAYQSTFFDLSQCSASDDYNCMEPYNALRPSIDHSREVVVLYLRDDAPADVTPLPFLVHPGVDMSDAVGETGHFASLVTWADANEPVVTTVGYGIGSHGYELGESAVRGRDFGVTEWVQTSSSYGNHRGLTDCNTRVTGSAPAVVVSPEDLTVDDIGGTGTLGSGPNGVQYGAAHSTPGAGDSGGPVLVGAGAVSKGVSPDPLPTPTLGDDYDVGRSYIAGTASIYTSGSSLTAAFAPTWTLDASQFLAAALHDSDHDGLADAVDDDIDGDGCANDVDQHPTDFYVEVGTILGVNCPGSEPWLEGEDQHSDGDGVPDCMDDDDDDDGIPDDLDPCPIHATNFCIQWSHACPYVPVFVDCYRAGCVESIIRLSELVNPDPTSVLEMSILSVDESTVIVAPPAGVDVSALADELADVGRGGVHMLEVVHPDGTAIPIAAYESSGITVDGLRGATALAITLGPEGDSVAVEGASAR